jgi:hypothetical protein
VAPLDDSSGILNDTATRFNQQFILLDRSISALRTSQLIDVSQGYWP